jgi:hypothetical protein
MSSGIISKISCDKVRNNFSLAHSPTLTISQLAKFSLLMSCYFRMECRRWAQSCDAAGFTGLSFGFLFGRWVDGLDLVHGFCRDAGMYQPSYLI